MEVITDLGACPRPAARCVVTIGAYDGVHLGHRAVVERVRGIAAELGCATAVVTFDRHPATVVRPDSAPLVLTDLEQKVELLGSTGVDYTLVLRFDEARSQESAEDFVAEVLVGCFAARVVVVGHDFHFGHRRRGNVELLRTMGAELDFEVTDLALVTDAEGAPPISSTRIRQLLVKGDVVEAARLLGRPHEVRGTVQRGDARGGELGFPTANVSAPGSILLPADGIYAGWYERPDGSLHGAAISVGARPTFYRDGASMVEAYLLDFDGDLYGERAKVRFVAPVREGQVAFESVDELVAQMGRDVVATRAVLAP
ncbi:MAG: bifunctional riboflavin kinase/FAD synthetase [Chloroflexi bacterium]|nr:MAG: bifunctional riboflavin kinase/FAD synthetase [Chloroflexota bacterium]TML38721.1 MAG: bifunctional riboflavin kinase/FAD synthetase [Actinomycetota bacterium]